MSEEVEQCQQPLSVLRVGDHESEKDSATLL